jgi:hypothetical protein
MKEYAHNFWTVSPSTEIQCDASFFMPNGIFISMTVCKSDRISDIKEQLWQKAKTDYPSRGLGDSRYHVFTTINPNDESPYFACFG